LPHDTGQLSPQNEICLKIVNKYLCNFILENKSKIFFQIKAHFSGQEYYRAARQTLKN
jgi:hypothetical protein